MFHFASGVQRVGIHHDQARAHGPKHYDRVLGHVGHLHRNPVARLEVGLVLQPGGKIPALGVQVAIGERGANGAERGAVSVLVHGLIKYVNHATVFIQVYVQGHASGVFVLIELLKIHHHLLFGICAYNVYQCRFGQKINQTKVSASKSRERIAVL